MVYATESPSPPQKRTSSRRLEETDMCHPNSAYETHEIIHLNVSDGSDIEIISENITVGAGRSKQQKHKKIRVRVNSVKNLNDEDSFIKEEIIISDASDSADEDYANTIHAKNQTSMMNRRTSKFKRRAKFRNRNDSFSSIILNCPKCNKTEVKLSATITSICKECKVDMTYQCDKCHFKYGSMSALYRHKKLQCQVSLPVEKRLTPIKMALKKCPKCNQIERNDKRSPGTCSKCKISKIFECGICSTNYNSYSGFQHHIKNQCQTVIQTYYCNECDYNTNQSIHLYNHLIDIHSDQFPLNVNCARCKKTFGNPLQLKQHELTCGLPVYQCKFCTFKPRLQTNLRNHLVKKHSDKLVLENIDSILTDAASGNLFGVNESTPTKDSQCMTKENFGTKDIKSAFCPKCNVAEPYQRGKYTCHLCSGLYRFYCKHCQKSFKAPDNLYRHVRRVHGNRQFKCKNCGKTFSFFGDYNAHIKACGQEPRFSCELCSFKTRYRHNLQGHKTKLHNKTRTSFACAECGIVYKTERSLNRHIELGCGK